MAVVFDTIEGSVEPEAPAQETGDASTADAHETADPGMARLEERHRECLSLRLLAD